MRLGMLTDGALPAGYASTAIQSTYQTPTKHLPSTRRAFAANDLIEQLYGINPIAGLGKVQCG